MKAVVRLSGGVDSVTLLHYVKKRLNCAEVYAVSFRYGQRHSRELEMAEWQAKNVGVNEHRQVDISSFGDLTGKGSVLTDKHREVLALADIEEQERSQPPTYVPNRNMVLLSLSAAYAEAIGVADVYYGAQAQDEYGYWDCTVAFVERINSVLNLNRREPVRVHAPFVEMSKVEVVKIGLELGVDYLHTWTCYRGGEEACGECPSCVERNAAFKAVDARN
jgi:7-cyano-7-deazaguanine synthase